MAARIFYREKKNWWHKKRGQLILPIFIVVMIVFLNSRGLLERPKNIFLKIIYPLQKTIYSIGIDLNQSINSLRNIKELKRENNNLQEENQKFKGEIIRLGEVDRENNFLRQQLNLSDNPERQLILANVIGQGPTNLGKYFFIDRGKKDGLKEELIAITAGNLLVGRVVEVLDSSAKVLLFTHPESRIDVLIQESRVAGLMRGGLVMDWILPNEKIEIGQSVITSGLSGIFPRGLLIGQVEEVIYNDVQIFQKAKIRPDVDFNKLEKVLVIL